ncbi:hypothetical protein [Kitasatospora sp. NPDC058218]|uniref:hypothetical protein n=1 Tax=Kitasatospora sp. NPDC058218 TaxID=3346385 RepID=UPI0036DCC357
MSTALLTARPTTAARPAAPALPAWAPRVPALAALALLPWLAVLAACHETAWVALDLAELTALLGLDALLRRRSPAAFGAACLVALLLAGDALADIGTAAPGLPLLAALVMAGCVELPLAALCLALGRRAGAGQRRRPARRPTAMTSTRARVSSSAPWPSASPTGCWAPSPSSG